MRSVKKFLTWRVGFAVFCLVYLIWVVQLSRNNFDMVHSQYRRIEMRLQPERVAQTAFRELVEQCRRQAGQSGLGPVAGVRGTVAAEEPCRSWPAAAVTKQQQQVQERLTHERNLAIRKLVLFYASFGFFFLVVPPALLYLLLSFFSWLFRNITVAR